MKVNTPILFPIKKISEKNFNDRPSLSHKYPPPPRRSFNFGTELSWIKDRRRATIRGELEALIKTNPRIRGRGNAARSLFRDNKTVARYPDGEAACHAMRMATEEWIMKHLSKLGETNFYYLHWNQCSRFPAIERSYHFASR